MHCRDPRKNNLLRQDAKRGSVNPHDCRTGGRVCLCLCVCIHNYTMTFRPLIECESMWEKQIDLYDRIFWHEYKMQQTESKLSLLNSNCEMRLFGKFDIGVLLLNLVSPLDPLKKSTIANLYYADRLFKSTICYLISK